MAVQRQMPSAQSVEQIRARARRRLIGAFVLVVVAVALFAWLFDSSPRQTNVDIPIEVAGQTPSDSYDEGPESLPLSQSDTEAQGSVNLGGSMAGVVAGVEITGAGTGGSDQTDVPPGNALPGGMIDLPSHSQQNPGGGQQAAGEGDTEPVQEGVSVYNYGSRPANMPYLKSKYPPNMASQVASAQPPRNTGGGLSASERRAAELLGELPPSSSNAGAGRTSPSGTGQKFVVQVGAYAEQSKVDEVRTKLSTNGFSSFVQEVHTDAGKRIRVRVGPFDGRYAADNAADKIKGLGLQVSVMAM